MMKAGAALLFVGLTLGLWSSIGGQLNQVKVELPHGFGIEKQMHYEQMHELYSTIERALVEKLALNDDPELNIKSAKEILKEKSKFQWNLRPLRRALKLFISLEKTVGKCDYASYLILAKNMLAAEKERAKHGRILRAVNDYRRRHAEKCRPEYRKSYRNYLNKMNRVDLERVRSALANLEVEHVTFTPPRERPVMTAQAMELATVIGAKLVWLQTDNGDYDYSEPIAEQVAKMLKQDGQWRKIRRSIDGSGLIPLDELKELAKKYVIRPCKKYVESTKEVMRPARFDAGVMDEQQFSYLMDDLNFARALVNFRICSLLKNDDEDASQRIAERLQEIRERSRNIGWVLPDLPDF